MKDFFLKNLVGLSITLVLVLMAITTFLSYHSKQIIEENYIIQHQTDSLKQNVEQILTNTLHRLDLGIRGYALTKDKKLLEPFDIALRENEPLFGRIENQLKEHDYDMTSFSKLREEMNSYIKYCQQMVEVTNSNDSAKFTQMLKADKGFEVWKEYDAFQKPLFLHENQMRLDAQERYEVALERTNIMQVILLLVSIPTLFLIFFRIKNDEKKRIELLQTLDENNKLFMFNPGDDNTIRETKDAERVVQNSINNFRKAADFIKNISSGNYDVQWEGLTKDNAKANSENLAGELVKMREQMKSVKAEDEKRLWANEGLAKFSEIVRNHQNNLESLCHESVRFLTKYLNVQQGSLFVLEESGFEPYLELVASYAFDKRKFIEKRIDIGNGLIGQTYLEKKTVVMTEVPQGYVKITSGLGDATPDALIIVPMQYNEKVQAILEMAGFGQFEPHQVNFLERCGEFVASALVNARTAGKMQELLEQSHEQAEMMKAQEEELRQNMEEMQATQEEMQRKTREMEIMQEELQKESALLNALLSSSEDTIYFKDTESRFLRLSNSFLKLDGIHSLEALIGKSDFDFFPKDIAQVKFNSELQIMKTGIPLKTVESETMKDGSVKWIASQKFPLKDSDGKTIGTFGVSRDITELKQTVIEAEKNSLLLKNIINNLPKGIFWKESKNLTFLGANKIFTDIAGFTPETIVGKTDYDCPWKKEESDMFRADDFNVIKNKLSKIDIEEQNTNASGETNWLSTSKVPIVDDDGEVIAVLGMFEDITQRKNQEADYKRTLREVEILKAENEELKTKIKK
jgi:PAS domain S-box-containing protein